MCIKKTGLTGLPARAGRNLSPGPRAGPARGRAFTLAELIVVMVILGVMAALVMPYAVSSSGSQAQAAARMLSADIEYAQNLATVTQAWVQVNIDVANKHYWITNASGDVSHPITQKSKYEFSFGGSGFDKVTLANASFGGGSNLRFGPLGDPVSGGSVQVVAGATSYTLTVAPVTGKVTVTQP